MSMRLLTRKIAMRCIGLLFFCALPLHAEDQLIHHSLQVEIDPQHHLLRVTDQLSGVKGEFVDFVLHAGLEPRVTSRGAKLMPLGRIEGDVELESWRVQLETDIHAFTMQYGGVIAHEFEQRVESPGRRQQLLAGSISPDGVFLDGGSAWYPLLDNVLQTFDLQIDLPLEWLAVSQGDGPTLETRQQRRIVKWSARNPQDDIYLIAGAFHLYQGPDQRPSAQVFLLRPDEALAQTYLDATQEYLDMYSEMLGDYPYSKFALVENFWQTGYGMPSFTLLGSRVIRLPFILHSSYPHEILHNWWGNGVFVDYASGNWSEGLTAYLADHLIKEQRGAGAEHRRDALQRYANFVRDENDFPLREFRSRHSGSSQAVGYDKALMFFHMLRRQLGDEVFLRGLRRLYHTRLFEQAGYGDLRAAFEQVSGRQLKEFFGQWIERTGAPQLRVNDTRVTRLIMGYRVELELWQEQENEPFLLDIPLLIYPGDGSAPVFTSVQMSERAQRLTVDVDFPPARVDIDPWFDLFRQLDASEVPPTLGNLFGSERVTIVLPGAAPRPLREGWRKLAQNWAAGYQDAQIVIDDELPALPADREVWILGWENRFARDIAGKLPSGNQLVKIDGRLELAGHSLGRDSHSIAVVARGAKDHVRGWIASNSVASLPGLARKLPHYGKYSYLAFAGDEPSIQVKGQWPVVDSRLQITLDPAGSISTSDEPPPLWPPASQPLSLR